MIDRELLKKDQAYSEPRDSCIIFICTLDPFGLGFLRYTLHNYCGECPDLVLPDKTTSIFLNAKGTSGEEHPDIRGFLDYVKTNTATDGLAKELATCVDSIKADGKEKEIYMTLAMDLQMCVDREKQGWMDEGRRKGRSEGRQIILMNMLSSGQTP